MFSLQKEDRFIRTNELNVSDLLENLIIFSI